MKNAIIVVAIGFVLIFTTLVFSTESRPQRSFLGNLQQMDFVIVEGEYVTEPGRILGQWEGRTTIPTKYPFMLSVIITVTGIVMLIISIVQRRKDSDSGNKAE